MKFHVLGQAADIVMRFDQMRLAGLGAGGFDHVRIDGALRQPFRVLEFGGLFLEHLDEQIADGLALALGILDTVERLEKTCLGIDADNMHAHVFGEGRHDLIAFLMAQQSVVDEHAGEFVADGAMQQRRDHRGIDTTGQTEQHFIIADLLADGANTFVGDIAGGPQCVAAADLTDKARKNASALAGMRHFRMKLHTVEVPCLVGHTGNRCTVGAGHQFETGRQIDHAIAMTHPHVEQAVAFVAGVVFDVFQQLRVAACAHLRIAVFVMVRRFDLAAQLFGHGLHAVADAEHRHAQLK